MNWEIFADPLFRLPFVAGLLIAGVLPVLGALLMLRDEWLAALGLAHLAAAGALLGLALGAPAVLGASLGALGGGAVKSIGGARGNTAYGFMVLIGWSALLLAAANTSAGDALGQAVMDGQLYFAGRTELAAAVVLVGLAVPALHRLMPQLLRARFFPRHATANRLPAWRWHLAFDLLAALGVAVGTATLGLLGTFALILVPAWAAFQVATGWAWTLWLAGLLGVLAYLAAFVLALGLDQPFGPLLAALCLACGGLIGALRQSGSGHGADP
ncbi:metal ABC transporter permease [Candidatus Thiodictyon syntrophicum]|jgi:zinc transport system permease protein|uniref:ABC transporter n=1 Tax=Candidatus Thiodictyon syntrophicum TaxID=1166950 RepID=A0A2K8UH36_9GAMM|nr:metal ABC transporter permease [Candidatus Thiodictyon syntrophicum]AUB84847.1 ABC transporter [Candidatus Thiodictyon syntrophicum]